MKKKLTGLLSAGALVAAGVAGVASFTSDADAAGNILDTHSATAQLVTYGGGALCSAVWVGPQAVLTAAHCVGSEAGEVHVVSDHLADQPLSDENVAEVVWASPGGADMVLLHTPNMSVDYYAPISATPPTLGASGQICGLNQIDNAKEVVGRGEDNYCGNINFYSIQKVPGSAQYGELLLTQPVWGFPGDSGGPVYDSAGTVQGVTVLHWKAGNWTNPRYDYLLNSNGLAPTYRFVNELRAHGAVVKGESPNTGANASAPSIADGTYVITSALNNNKALDVNAQSRFNGANVQLWDRNNGPAQRFKVTHLGGNQYSIVNIHSNKALDIDGASRFAGANVHQWSWNGGGNQKFYITPAPQGGYTIQAVSSYMMLDVYGSRTANGTNVIQWNDNGGSANQRWNFNLQ